MDANPHGGKILEGRGKYFFEGNGHHLANPSLWELEYPIHKGKIASSFNCLEIIFSHLTCNLQPTTTVKGWGQ